MVPQPVRGRARIQNPGLSLNLMFFFSNTPEKLIKLFFHYQRLIRQKHPIKIFVGFLELNWTGSLYYFLLHFLLICLILELLYLMRSCLFPFDGFSKTMNCIKGAAGNIEYLNKHLPIGMYFLIVVVRIELSSPSYEGMSTSLTLLASCCGSLSFLLERKNTCIWSVSLEGETEWAQSSSTLPVFLWVSGWLHSTPSVFVPPDDEFSGTALPWNSKVRGIMQVSMSTSVG